MQVHPSTGPFARQYVVIGKTRVTRYDSLNHAITAGMKLPNAVITHGGRTVGWCGSRAERLWSRRTSPGPYARSAETANAGEAALFALFQPARLTPVRGMRSIEVCENSQLGPQVRYDPELYSADDAREWERDCRP